MRHSALVKVKATATHKEEQTESFFHLLHEYFSIHRDVAFYADRLCITTKYLAKVIYPFFFCDIRVGL